MIAHHEFLRQTLGDIGRDAAGILADEFDLLARDRIAVLLHIELDAVVDLRAGVGKLAGILVDNADLDGVLRAGRPETEHRQRKARPAAHRNFRIVASQFA